MNVISYHIGQLSDIFTKFRKMHVCVLILKLFSECFFVSKPDLGMKTQAIK